MEAEERGNNCMQTDTSSIECHWLLNEIVNSGVDIETTICREENNSHRRADQKVNTNNQQHGIRLHGQRRISL